MLKFDAALTTTVQVLSGDKVWKSTVTDTLFVSEVRIDFTTGAMYATILRGMSDVSGKFQENYPSLKVVVNPDGSFISADGMYAGTISIAPLVAALATQFDQFVSAALVQTGK